MKKFLIEKATNLGAQNCAKCNESDFSFGLLGQNGSVCFNCNSPVVKYSPHITFHMALEVFKELLINYDDYNFTSSKNVVIGYVDKLILDIQLKAKIPANEDIILLQTFFNYPGKHLLGSGVKLGGAILIDGGKFTIVPDKQNLKVDQIKILGVLAS